MKVFFTLLVALGAALYFPRSRTVVLDFAAPVIDPVLAWSTEGEMRAMARDLEQRANTGRPIPQDAEEFSAWLERNYQGGDSRRDTWGNRYMLRMWIDSFRILSAGPDGEVGTGDDLGVTTPIERDR